MQVILVRTKVYWSLRGVIITPLPLSGKSITWKDVTNEWQAHTLIYQAYMPIRT
jgi:hypothetical protein